MVRKVGQEAGLLYLQRLQSTGATEPSVHSMALSHKASERRRLAGDAIRIVSRAWELRVLLLLLFPLLSPRVLLPLHMLVLPGGFSERPFDSHSLSTKCSFTF